MFWTNLHLDFLAFIELFDFNHVTIEVMPVNDHFIGSYVRHSYIHCTGAEFIPRFKIGALRNYSALLNLYVVSFFNGLFRAIITASCDSGFWFFDGSDCLALVILLDRRLNNIIENFNFHAGNIGRLVFLDRVKDVEHIIVITIGRDLFNDGNPLPFVRLHISDPLISHRSCNFESEVVAWGWHFILKSNPGAHSNMILPLTVRRLRELPAAPLETFWSPRLIYSQSLLVFKRRESRLDGLEWTLLPECSIWIQHRVG